MKFTAGFLDMQTDASSKQFIIWINEYLKNLESYGYDYPDTSWRKISGAINLLDLVVLEMERVELGL